MAESSRYTLVLLVNLLGGAKETSIPSFLKYSPFLRIIFSPMYKHLAVFSLVVLSLSLKAQDTNTVMFYNLLQYPEEKPERISYLKTILDEISPEVFMVCELSNNAGSINILTQALNTNGESRYQRASFWDDGDFNNMMYYDQNKYKLIFQDTIASTPRFATVYSLLDNSTKGGDSIILNFIVVHLKAGRDDASARGTAAKKIRRYIDQEMDGENIFLAGDFNIYSPKEAAFQTFTNSGVTRFNDPIDKIGEWSNSMTFAEYHTQSTRVNNFGGGSSGGMDDRFDWILTTNDILKGENKVTYIENSYKAYGNDGSHFNMAINSGTNSAVSGKMAEALHEMSDHLPVIMKVSIEKPNSIRQESSTTKVRIGGYHGKIHVNLPGSTEPVDIAVYDVNGKCVERCSDGKILPNWESTGTFINGIYVVRVTVNEEIVTRKVVLAGLN